jgi:hypothetical protein
LVLVLPRFGRLTAALRLLAAHAPFCLLPFAHTYGGDASPHTGFASSAAAATSLSPSPTVLLHWQLLHGVLLLHLYFSTYAEHSLRAHRSQ